MPSWSAPCTSLSCTSPRSSDGSTALSRGNPRGRRIEYRAIIGSYYYVARRDRFLGIGCIDHIRLCGLSVGAGCGFPLEDTTSGEGGCEPVSHVYHYRLQRRKTHCGKAGEYAEACLSALETRNSRGL